MIMPNSGLITVDGVQLHGLGQTSQKGRYPIHWHLGDDRSGDVLKNSSITNSNNRGVTIHGASNLQIEGVVLHDVHGHGFFFEDAVETGNILVGNIALGIHKVGGNDQDFSNPGGTDPFVVDTHDNVRESNSRFLSSAAFWITNPDNTLVGNISAGASGTGFWYAIPRTVLGASGTKAIYDDVIPIYAEFGQFDDNVSHSTPVGVNFDRGSDVEDGSFSTTLRTNDNADNYSPRTGGLESGTPTTNYINGFTSYKATDAGVYHRGQGNSILFNGLRIADNRSAAWAVFETEYNDSLFVGHSIGNADLSQEVGGPRLYDGAGLYTNTHFAGFAGENAYTFQVEGSSFGPTMYHAFQATSFEDDGTYSNISHAVSDFTRVDGETLGEHNLAQPAQWIKAALDLDGTLTGGAGGGAGFTIVPNVDFLIEEGEGRDIQPLGWDAWLTDDIYARVQVGNNNSGETLFPSYTDDPLVRFTARSGVSIDATGGQNNGDASWIHSAAKTEGDGYVDGTHTVEFLRDGVPTTVFDLNIRTQDGGLPALNPAIQAKVEAARVVVKVVGAGNYTLERGTEVASEEQLRSVTSDLAYYRDGLGNLYINSGITEYRPSISLTPGEPLQTEYVARTLEYGTVIEAEEFDNGIDGIAYQDADQTNSLGTFRAGDNNGAGTGVDVTSTAVGNVADGEWLEYTTDIVGTAYDIGVNVSSSQAGGQIRVLAGESNSSGYFTELGTVSVVATEGAVSTLLIGSADLTTVTGPSSVIRLEFIGDFADDFLLDSVQFDAPAQTAYAERTITANFTTTRIQLPEFDYGGQGVAYNDTTPENSLENNTYRTNEGVETDGTLITNDVIQGEWLEYTTDIQAGLYDITLRKAWGGGDAGVKLFIGESNSTTEFTELGFFPLEEGEFVTRENIDLSPWAGSDRVIRIEIVGNYMGIEYLDFASQTPAGPTADLIDVSPDPSNTNAGVVSINFDRDVTGFDVSDLTLTRNGTAVDISGLTVTQISASQYSIDLTAVTTINGAFELTLNSTGSGIQDTNGIVMTSDAVDQFVIDRIGPQVSSMIVNSGHSGRSRVTHAVVTFNEVVDGVDADAFLLMNTTNNTQVIPTVTTEVINKKTVATLTFSDGESLADGNYTLTTLYDRIRDAAGNLLNQDHDQAGASGNDATDTFFQKYGDQDGDGTVGLTDFAVFRSAFGSQEGDANFLAGLDSDSDGSIDLVDFAAFRSNFGN